MGGKVKIFFKTKIERDHQIYPAPCFKMNAEDKFCLKWNDFQENIKTSFAELRWDKDLVDVTLACEDGQLDAHKVVLASGSPFFKKLLEKTSKHMQPFLFMRGLKTRQLTTMVDFIYLGEVNIRQEDLDGFLLLAQELELKGLTGEDTGTEEIGMNKFEICPGKESKRDLGNQNYSNKNNQRPKIVTSNEANQDMCPTETKTLVPAETNMRQRIHIENDVLQLRETMFEKVDNLWTCKVCKFTSGIVGNLREHVEKHIEGVEYPCNLCGKVMRSSKSLRNHHSMKRCPYSKSNH